jgi:hypothetical protein
LKICSISGKIEPMNSYRPLPYPLVVATGNHAAKKQLLETASEYALTNSLYLSIADNQSEAFMKAVGIPFFQTQPGAVRKQIYLSRSYTCYELTCFLEEVSSGIQPMMAIFSLDYLASFYDEGVPYAQARELLETSIRYLQAIRQTRPVVVYADPPDNRNGRMSFYELLYSDADSIVNLNI